MCQYERELDNSLYERLLTVINKYVLLPEMPIEELKLINLNDYGLNSLNTIRMILEFEDSFNIQFPDDLITFDNTSTPEEILKTIKKILSEGK